MAKDPISKEGATPKSIHEKMFTMMSVIEMPVKNQTMKIPGRKDFKYADLAACREVIVPALKEAELYFTQKEEDRYEKEAYLITRIQDTTSIEFIESITKIPAGMSPKDKGGWLTYNKRYHLTGLFGLAAEDDEDADALPKDIPPQKPPLKSDMEIAKELADKLRKQNEERAAAILKKQSAEPDPKPKPIQENIEPVTKETADQVGEMFMTGKTFPGMKIKDVWQVSRAKALMYAIEVKKYAMTKHVDKAHQSFIGYGIAKGYLES